MELSQPQIGAITFSPGAILGGTFIFKESGPTLGHAWQTWTTHIAAEAIHNSEAVRSQDMCLQGTRTAVLRLLADFLESETSSASVLWLNGPAGAGKSAIMRTIACSAAERHILLASFFFFRADDRRNTIRPLIPTIAFQMTRNLSNHVAGLTSCAERFIQDDPTLFSQPSPQQAEILIHRVISEALGGAHEGLAHVLPMAILIDGLDECTGTDKQIEVVEILTKAVSRVGAETGLKLRLVIASRPEYHLEGVFRDKQEAGDATILTLNEDFKPDADISLYLDVHFTRIRKTHPFAKTVGLSFDWPTPDDKVVLLQKASGQFVFARTSVKFVGDPHGDPRERLKMILGLTLPGPLQPFEYLDYLYMTVFSLVPQEILPETLRLVSAVLVPNGLGPQPSLSFLSSLFQIPLPIVQRGFLHLTSLFNFDVQPGGKGVGVYHASLADFLFAKHRSEKFQLFTPLATVQSQICEALVSAFESDEPPFQNLDYRHWEVCVRNAPGILPLNDHGKGLLKRLLQVQPAHVRRTGGPRWLLLLIVFRWKCQKVLPDDAIPFVTKYLSSFKTSARAEFARCMHAYLEPKSQGAGSFCMALLRTEYDWARYALGGTHPWNDPGMNFELFARVSTIRYALSQDEALAKVDSSRSYGWNLTQNVMEEVMDVDLTMWHFEPDTGLHYSWKEYLYEVFSVLTISKACFVDAIFYVLEHIPARIIVCLWINWHKIGHGANLPKALGANYQHDRPYVSEKDFGNQDCDQCLSCANFWRCSYIKEWLHPSGVSLSAGEVRRLYDLLVRDEGLWSQDDLIERILEHSTGLFRRWDPLVLDALRAQLKNLREERLRTHGY